MLRQRGRVGLVTAALLGLMFGSAHAQSCPGSVCQGGSNSGNPCTRDEDCPDGGICGACPFSAVTTERSSSILIFPKVVADGTRDTIIQITNTGNSMVNVHCFYVDGGPVNFFAPVSLTNPPRCSEIDFDFLLTKQQPTHWVASLGRVQNPFATQCSPTENDCNDAGLFTGQIPPVEQPFTGELKCIEVDMSGNPVSGNHLKGEAEIEVANVCDPSDGTCFIDGNDTCTTSETCLDVFDISKYNAIGIQGNENNNGDNVLCLGGGVTDQCPNGQEYDACPAVWIANHYADDAPDLVAPDSDVDTDWTFVPCTENFETQAPTPVTIQILTYNEFENVFSSNLSFSCWADLELDDINPTVFSYTNTLQTTFAESRLRSSNATGSGFLMVQSEKHSTSDDWATFDDVNNHVEGLRTQGDTITVPFDQLSIGGVGGNP